MCCFMYLALHNKLSCLSGGCHLVRRCRMDPWGIIRRCCSWGKHNAPSDILYVLGISFLQFPSETRLLSKPGTVPAERQKQKSICFSYCTPSPHHFSGEALHRGNNISSLEGKDWSHYPLLCWPCNRMKKGLFSSSFPVCPGPWPSTYFCIKLFSLKLKCSWSSI